GIDGGWIVPQFEVKHGVFGTWHVQGGIRKSLRNRNRVFEVGVRSHGTEQEQVRSAQDALFIWTFGTAHFFHAGKTNQRGQRLPVALRIAVHRAKTSRTEGGRSEALEGIDGRHHGMSILRDKAALVPAE